MGKFETHTEWWQILIPRLIAPNKYISGREGGRDSRDVRSQPVSSTPLGTQAGLGLRYCHHMILEKFFNPTGLQAPWPWIRGTKYLTAGVVLEGLQVTGYPGNCSIAAEQEPKADFAVGSGDLVRGSNPFTWNEPGNRALFSLPKQTAS